MPFGLEQLGPLVHVFFSLLFQCVVVGDSLGGFHQWFHPVIAVSLGQPPCPSNPIPTCVDGIMRGVCVNICAHVRYKMWCDYLKYAFAII